MSKSKPIKGPYQLALFFGLKRSLRRHSNFYQGEEAFLLLKAPRDVDPGDYAPGVVRIFNQAPNLNLEKAGFMTIRASEKNAAVLNNFESECEEKNRVIIIRDHDADTPPRVALAIDDEVTLEAITPLDFRAACRVALGIRVSQSQAEAALEHPSELLWAALRKGRPIEDVLARLAKTSLSVAGKPCGKATDVPELIAMHGYGSAKTWGIELAQDLSDWRRGKIDWSEVDKGIVLSGPPGVGKTIFAKALAAHCNVPIIATSLGQWQANGHLGDLLKAMRRDFNNAKDSAPSILFCDELDSFGDRNSFSDDNRDYSTQVVNAFLEHVDGLGGREGVIVIGATNNISRIDPAILRPGRLDRHVEIPLPAAADRIAILHQQLGGAIALERLQGFVAATQGFSGADLAKVARDAHRMARRKKRDLILEDVIDSLPEMVPILGKHRRALAVHEAGHTVAVLRLNHGTYRGTVIANQARRDSVIQRGGGAYFELPAIAYRNVQFYRNHILVLLAGIAAEEVCLGSISDGAGVGENSDLANATRVATAMQTQMGMGSRFRHSLGREDPDLEKLRHADPTVAKWVDDVLATEFARAKQLLRDDRVFLDRIANALEAEGSVSAEEVSRLDHQIKPLIAGEASLS